MLNKPILLLAALLLVSISHPSRADYNMPIDIEDSLDSDVSHQQMKPLLDTEVGLDENVKRQILSELSKEKFSQMTEMSLADQITAATTQMVPIISQELQEGITTVQFFDHIAFSPSNSKVADTVRDNLKETAFSEKLKNSLEKLNPYFQTYFWYQSLD